MSSFLYGALTRKREEANADKSDSEEAPGVGTYADALAALVPAEVLAIHAVVIDRATTTKDGITTIVAPEQLVFWFWFLVVASIALYAAGLQAVPKGWDFVRALIPPVAFLGWTMLQPVTVFDALAVSGDADWRWTGGLAIAVIVSAVSGWLGTKEHRASAKRRKPRRAGAGGGGAATGGAASGGGAGPAGGGAGGDGGAG